jgi:hypothetical protein
MDSSQIGQPDRIGAGFRWSDKNTVQAGLQLLEGTDAGKFYWLFGDKAVFRRPYGR